MKIHLDRKIIFLLLILVNAFLFYVLINLAYLKSSNSIFNIDEQVKSSEVPVINKSIDDIRVNSKAFIIYDPSSRAIIAGKNEKLRFAPASSAKIMTATVV